MDTAKVAIESRFLLTSSRVNDMQSQYTANLPERCPLYQLSMQNVAFGVAIRQRGTPVWLPGSVDLEHLSIFFEKLAKNGTVSSSLVGTSG